MFDKNYLDGCSAKKRTTVFAVGIKPFHEYSELGIAVDLWLVHLVWGSDIRFAEILHFGGVIVHDDRSQALEGHRRHVSMRVLSNWFEEDEARESITPL